jgi:16S rRNA (cytosine967-C5)-methyltransferase
VSKAIRIAAAVIAKADTTHPADAALRAELKAARGLARNEGRAISNVVFSYYRWFRWLDEKSAVPARIEQAVKLSDAFQKNTNGVPDAELRQAIPDWANEQVQVSPDWLRSLQTEPALWLRARRGTGRGLAARLGDCWIAADASLSDALRYEGEEDLFRTPEFHAGEFELQDLSSQAVGLVCNPQPGETWWDACAGEGGKTLHLCDLMQNKGLVWASDRAEWRLRRLKQRAARARVFNYRTALWDGGKKLPTKTKFDGILVDAPCSGVGTWQRNPHARWTTTLEDVNELAAVQKNLLANAVVALKPGARLIYSVCTLTKAETVEVAEAITMQFPELEPLLLKNPLRADAPGAQMLWLWPQTTAGNGMFICGWQRRIVDR